MSALPVHARRRVRADGWLPLPQIRGRFLRFRRSSPKTAAPPARSAGPGTELTGALATFRQVALAAIAVLVTVASLVSFAESYRGLYEWAARHGPSGIWVAIWPLMVDVFIAVGELALFVGLLLTDQWRWRSRAGAWAVTAVGLAVSVAGNIGHVAGHSLTDRATAAVPPLAAAASLAVGLGVLKRVVQGRAAPATASLTPAAAVTPAPGLPPDGPASPSPTVAGPVRAPGRAAAPAARRNGRGRVPGRPPVTAETVMAHYADELVAGRVPSQYAIRTRWHVGSGTARKLRDVLIARAAALSETRTTAEGMASAPRTVALAGQDQP